MQTSPRMAACTVVNMPGAVRTTNFSSCAAHTVCRRYDKRCRHSLKRLHPARSNALMSTALAFGSVRPLASFLGLRLRACGWVPTISFPFKSSHDIQRPRCIV